MVEFICTEGDNFCMVFLLKCFAAIVLSFLLIPIYCEVSYGITINQ